MRKGRLDASFWCFIIKVMTGSKSVTNETLARMIERGFAEAATKKDLNAVVGRLEIVEARLENVEGHLGGLENKVDANTEELRLTREANGRWRAHMESDIFDLDERVSHLEKKGGSRH